MVVFAFQEEKRELISVLFLQDSILFLCFFMLNRIISFSIHNKLIIGLFVLFLVTYGGYQVTRLPIDAVPDITDNQVQVITVAPALGAPDVERFITFPIEQVSNNIPGLKSIRSFSRFGLSVVTIVFNDDVDVYWARQQVNERLQQVQQDIPEGFGTPALAPVTTGLGEIYQYCLRPEKGYEGKYGPMELRTLQDWVVRRQLLGVKGVADVGSFGGQLRQYEISIDPNRLQSAGLTMSDVFDALEKNNQNTGGAYIEKGPTALFIRSEGLIGSKEDIGAIIVKQTGEGLPVVLRDIATVNIGFATRYGAMCYNNDGEVAGAVVMMLKGANSSEVIHDVKERIAEIQKSLPEGVIIEPFLDRTKMVGHAMSTVETNLLEGALIVLFVLILFLGNLRAGLIVASVIPLAMLFAIILMNRFGVAGNLMSLGALDFGLIVDGAVFIVEAVLHQLTHSKHFSQVKRLTRPQMDEEVDRASGKIARSVVFGQLIILIVYLPTFVLSGIEGKMFIPMAQTVSFALLGAFLLSITYVPMMSALFMNRSIDHRKGISDKIMDFSERKLQHAMETVLSHKKKVLLASVLLFILSLVVLSGLGGEFIPALEEGDFAVDTRVLTGSSLQTTIEYTQKAAHILRERFPEVEKVVTKIGSSEIPTDPMPMEAADMMVILKDKEEWTSAKTFPELSDKMEAAVADVPGITTGFQFPVQMRFNELMTGARQDVVCKIFGEDLDTLSRYASSLGEIVGTVEGAVDLYVEQVTGMPQVVVRYDRSAIARYGMSIDDVNRIVNTAFAGQRAGTVYEGEKRFDLVVRMEKGLRTRVEDIENLLVPAPDGSQIPLRQLAHIVLETGPNQIQREETRRRIIVGFNVRDRDVQSIVEELQRKVEAEIKLPSGYQITYGGSFENLNAAKGRLSIAVPIALLLIYLLLYFTFGSLRQGLLIYSAIPLSAIGGIFALAVRGMPFSISAGVGFIALFGVAVLNGIVLVAEFNRLKSEGWDDPRKIVLMGTKIRLRPVLMTAFVASLGFLPMALSNGAGAEVQRPLATVVIGGLLIATLLTLFVLPVLYIYFEKSSRKRVNVGQPAAVVFLLLLVSADVKAQPFISLQAAVDSARKNNLSLQGERYEVRHLERLRATAADLPSTDVSFGYGRINSSYDDRAYRVEQSFRFPTVYYQRQKLLNENWKQGEAGLALQEKALTREVQETFYALIHLQQKHELLLRADSIYAGLRRITELRFEQGEANVLEKSAAEVQQGQLLQQLQELEAELLSLRLHFNLLLNTPTIYFPEDADSRMEPPLTSDSASVYTHPALQVLKQEERASLANWKLAKAQFAPDLTAAYENKTMYGTGADNVFYDYSSRFASFQVGLSLPLFFGSKAGEAGAMRARYEKARIFYQYRERELSADYQKALARYRAQTNIVSNFEKSALSNARLMIQTAEMKFRNGDIDYLEWSIITANAIELESRYIDAVQKLNNAIIEIDYLTEK
jgi:cobalt-zinc-cadmium resistance protein CzcA